MPGRISTLPQVFVDYKIRGKYDQRITQLCVFCLVTVYMFIAKRFDLFTNDKSKMLGFNHQNLVDMEIENLTS